MDGISGVVKSREIFKVGNSALKFIELKLELKLNKLKHVLIKSIFFLTKKANLITLLVIILSKSFLKSVTKTNSLYQISSKMLHSTKVIILVEKKEKRWPGWDLNSRPPC